NIVGIKDTIDSVAHLRSMIHTVKSAHPHFTVLCGYDDHLFNTLLLGGDGAISASGNFAPQVSVNLLKAWRDQEVAKAAEYHQILLQIPQMYQLDTPFVNVIKEAIVLCGRPISTYVLPPASPLDEPRKAQLKTLLQQLKLC
ncbi:dihydrodipicolinate synthase family protein, partial [Enterobacter ludwigii]